MNRDSSPQFLLPASNPEVSPALRDMLSEHPRLTHDPPRHIATLLFLKGFLPYPPKDVEVEAALEALLIEGELVA